MEQQLIEFVDGIKSNKQVGTFDEASTKQAIVLRLLFLLGWDIFNIDEVNPNLANETPHADYALSIKSTPRVFIKVVKPKDYLDKYQENVFEYASKKKVEFAVLTNGVGWWFYLSSGKGEALQNRFAAVEFLQQPSPETAEQVTEFLKKDEISKGTALKGAKDILRKRLQQAARKAIPEAWSKMLSEPSEALIKLIGDTAEKICGVTPAEEAIVKFLNERLKEPQYTEALDIQPEEKGAAKPEKSPPPPEKAAPPTEKPAQKSYDGHSIASFSFKGKIYRVKSWEELLVKLCEVLMKEYHQDIDSLQWHSVGKKYYFSKNQNELRVPAGIAKTDIYVETYLSPNETVKVALSVLAGFGFAADDLKIS